MKMEFLHAVLKSLWVLLLLIPGFVFSLDSEQDNQGSVQIITGHDRLLVPASNDSIVIGTGADSSMLVPLCPWWGYSFTQTLYFQPEINIQDKRIYRIGYQYVGITTPVDFEVEIWMSHTTLNEITTSVPLSNSLKVYDGPYFLAAGEEFSYIDILPFFYNNTDNLLVTVIEKKPGYTSPSDMFLSTKGIYTQQVCLGARNDQTAYDPENLPTGSYIEERANIKLFFEDVPTTPEVKTTPDTLDFGQVEATQTSVQTVKVMNIGGGNLEITDAEFTNPHFTLLNATFPINLGAGESQIFDIQFAPTDPGFYEAEITFQMDAGIPGSKSAYLQGWGLRLGCLREGFEGQLFPPLGWKVYDVNNDAMGWFRNETMAPTGQTVPHTGVAAAGLDVYAGSPGEIGYNDWLVTPQMMYQDGDIFTFFIKRLAASQNGQVWRVCLSTTGDLVSNFTPIDVITDPPGTYVQKSYNLGDEGLTNGQMFYMAFQFNSLWCWPGVIDDVLGSVKLIVDNDLMAVSFEGNDIIYENTTNNYTAVVGNSGLNPVAAGVYQVQVCAWVNGVETAFGSVNGLAIEPGENITLTVPVLIPETGVYNLYSKIVWTGDMNPLNNQSEQLSVEVIGSSIVVKNIGDYPVGPETDYYNLYPINFSDWRGASLHECLYFSNELNTGGIINRLSYYQANGTLLPERKIKVWMVETSKENFDLGAIPANEMTLVFDGEVTFELGVSRVNLDLMYPFVYSGGGSIAVMVYYYQGGNPYIVDNALFAYQYMESGVIRNGFDNWITTVDPNDLSHMSYVPSYPITSLMFETGNGLGSISGNVMYYDIPGPVEGAKVEIENADFPGSKAVIYTGADGHFSAPYYLAGNNITVTISKYGFIDVVFENISLSAGGTVVLENAYLMTRPLIALTGNVLKSDTQGPAEGAIVRLYGLDNYETTTNQNGNFDFPAIWGLTTYQMEITLEGYQTYTSEIVVSEVGMTLEPVTLLENAPAPHIVNVVEQDANALLTWYGAGEPFPTEFRYDDGVLDGILITTGAVDIVGGSAWNVNSIVTGVQWYTYQSSSYPPSPQVMITILGLNQDGSPNPADILFTQGMVQNPVGWNTYALPYPVEAPNGFFFGISGYSNYVVVPYDDGVDEPWVFHPNTQWSNGMGAYYPLETVTAPPLFKNIFMRAYGFMYEMETLNTTDYLTPLILKSQKDAGALVCQPVESFDAGLPEIIPVDYVIPGNRSFQHYNIFRKLIEDEDWILINSTVTDTSYVDTDWENLEEGFYHYAVEAEYQNGVKSSLALSNVIEKIIDGVGENESGQLLVFPNPSSGLVTVKSPAIIQNLSVIDAFGRILMDKVVNNSEERIDLSGFGKGVYFIRIVLGEKQVIRRVTIK